MMGGVFRQVGLWALWCWTEQSSLRPPRLDPAPPSSPSPSSGLGMELPMTSSPGSFLCLPEILHYLVVETLPSYKVMIHVQNLGGDDTPKWHLQSVAWDIIL